MPSAMARNTVASAASPKRARSGRGGPGGGQRVRHAQHRYAGPPRRRPAGRSGTAPRPRRHGPNKASPHCARACARRSAFRCSRLTCGRGRGPRPRAPCRSPTMAAVAGRSESKAWQSTPAASSARRVARAASPTPLSDDSAPIIATPAQARTASGAARPWRPAGRTGAVKGSLQARRASRSRTRPRRPAGRTQAAMPRSRHAAANSQRQTAASCRRPALVSSVAARRITASPVSPLLIRRPSSDSSSWGASASTSTPSGSRPDGQAPGQAITLRAPGWSLATCCIACRVAAQSCGAARMTSVQRRGARDSSRCRVSPQGSVPAATPVAGAGFIVGGPDARRAAGRVGDPADRRAPRRRPQGAPRPPEPPAAAMARRTSHPGSWR
jgi:hypothetical protein